jgi:hypothetical protein
MGKQPDRSSPALPAKYATYLADGKLTAAEKAEAERLKATPLVVQRATSSSTPASLSMVSGQLVSLRPMSIGLPQSAGAPDNWSAWSLALRKAVVGQVNRWLGAAEIVSGWIQGCNAFSNPGAFRSAYPLAPMLDQELAASGLPGRLSNPLAHAFARAWADWSDSVTLTGLPFYPMFQAWPGPVSAVMSNLPTPLSACPSPGAVSLTPLPLAQRLQEALPADYAQQSARQPLQDFGSWFAGRFSTWRAGAVMQNVLGWGSTAYAPPYVPVSPVVNGTLRSIPGFITQPLT